MDYTSQLTTQTYPILDDYNCKLRLKEIDQSSQFVPKVGAVDEKTPGKTLCTLQTLPNTGICTGDLGNFFFLLIQVILSKIEKKKTEWINIFFLSRFTTNTR